MLVDPSKDAEIKKWAKVMNWIVSFVEPNIGLNLKVYQTATEMWNDLKKVYHQDNDARKFHINYEIEVYS